MSIEAMKQALEALKIATFGDHYGIGANAIDTLRQAIAEAETPARKPLTDEEINQIIASNVTITDRNLYGAVYMSIREVERAHGIGG